MFEEGARLKALHGADQVYDFSLGNPDVPPPAALYAVLRETVDSVHPGDHGYMPNAGLAEARRAVARFVSQEHKTPVCEEDIIMTCGAAGALNVIFRTLLDPGDEVIVPIPYFVEYEPYITQAGGLFRPVTTRPDFSLDVDAIGAALSPRTKALLINSPNNPTGVVYSRTSLVDCVTVLRDAGTRWGRPIYLIADEPYRRLVYDGIEVPPVLALYTESLVASSFSKSLSIPGERVGYIAVHPDASAHDELLAGLAWANRTLGFVNAPALMQRVIARLDDVTIDVNIYARRRAMLCAGLAEAGYEFVNPSGAFYLFPRSPCPDDISFVRALQKERILTVPGTGFGAPGYFRIAYCVSDDTICRALPRFAAVLRRFVSQR